MQSLFLYSLLSLFLYSLVEDGSMPTKCWGFIEQVASREICVQVWDLRKGYVCAGMLSGIVFLWRICLSNLSEMGPCVDHSHEENQARQAQGEQTKESVRNRNPIAGPSGTVWV